MTVISYEASALEVYSAKSLEGSPAFAAYEVESEELAGDLSSFALANAIYAGLVEGYAAEISSRRNAMENASKNAVSFSRLGAARPARRAVGEPPGRGRSCSSPVAHRCRRQVGKSH